MAAGHRVEVSGNICGVGANGAGHDPIACDRMRGAEPATHTAAEIASNFVETEGCKSYWRVDWFHRRSHDRLSLNHPHST